MKNSLLKLFSFAFITTVICFTILVANLAKAESALPIDDTEKIEQMTDKLVKKLLLTNEQTEAVGTILGEYFLGIAEASGNVSLEESLKKSATVKLLALLDKKQKMKFDIIEADWWETASK